MRLSQSKNLSIKKPMNKDLSVSNTYNNMNNTITNESDKWDNDIVILNQDFVYGNDDINNINNGHEELNLGGFK